MKRLVSSLVLSCMLLAQGSVLPAIAASDDYEDAIEYLLDEDIADGYDDGDFGENKPINRAEITKIILNAIDEEDGGSNCFLDVQKQWFAAYVCAAEDQNIVKGYPDGAFRPERHVTFAEAASLVVRAYDGSVSSGFGQAWYMPYVEILEDWDAIPQTIGMVHDPLTRGEMAYIIWRAEQEAGDADENEDEDEEDNDDDNDDDADLEVDVRSLQSEVAPGQSVTFIITIENDGDRDADINVELELDHGLTAIDAPGSDDLEDDAVRWDDLTVKEDDEIALLLVAFVEKFATVGSTLSIDVEAESEDASGSVRVKQATATGSTKVPYAPVGDPVLHWNEIAMQANADDHSGTFGNGEQVGPGGSSRALAMVHAAVYEAVNSIDKSYTPLYAAIPVPNEPISIDAAVAYAAHDVLVKLYPHQEHAFHLALTRHMMMLPDDNAKTLGTFVGQSAARQTLALRENDGSNEPDTHTASDLPGRHRKDPLNPNQPFLGAKWGLTKPFVLQSGTQFRAPPPPALTSPEYAAAFNEVKQMGGDGITTPTIRTPEQTQIGLFWAYDGTNNLGTPPRLYNQIARVIAIREGNTVAENARLFALINIAQADAGIVSWESKYFYDVWRPIVAIREADAGTGPTGLGDGNPLTAGDPTWTPLGGPNSNSTANNFTPPFPAYTSGHATFGAATFRIIEQFYGTDNVPFTFVSDELDGLTTNNAGQRRELTVRSFTRLSDASRENAQSRIYLGIHWQFDATEGIKMGNSIADYVFKNALTPVK